jgi:hypothetical protein
VFRNAFQLKIEDKQMLAAILVSVTGFLVFYSWILPRVFSDFRLLDHKRIPNTQKNDKTPYDHVVVIGGSLAGKNLSLELTLTLIFNRNVSS